MENLFDIKLVNVKDNPNHIEGEMFYTFSGIPYSKIICVGTFFMLYKGLPAICFKKEEFDFYKLLNEGGNVFWEQGCLAFENIDKSQIYLSAPIPEEYKNKIKNNGLLYIRVVEKDNSTNDYEIEELSLCY